MYIILDKINESVEENNEINYLKLITVVKNEYVLKSEMIWNKVKYHIELKICNSKKYIKIRKSEYVGGIETFCP